MTALDLIPSGALSPEVAERLAAMDALATGYLEGKVRPATKRAHTQDVRVWREYCVELGIPEGARSVGPVVGFVNWLFNKRAAPASTVSRRLSGVGTAFRRAGTPIDPDIMAAARTAIHINGVQLAEAGETRGRGKATPFTVPELREIYLICDGDTLIGLRDRAMVLLGFAIGARSEDPARMLVTDVEEKEKGLLVNIRWSKKGSRAVKVLYGQHLASCPVRAWKTWLKEYDASGGPAFPRIDRHGRVLGSISPQGVSQRLTELAARAGLGERTWHGVRSGMASAARGAGHDAISIAEQGGWTRTSASMMEYLHLIDGWGEDNALYGIGL